MFSILPGIKSGPAALEMLIFSNNFCTPFKVIDNFPIDGYLLPNIILLWGSVVKENHSLHLLQKKAVRIITNSDYLAHTEPICKKLRILKISDMFSVALWKFYYKLMNNKLPAYFSFMKPVLPTVTERYEIRNPSFHTPAIKHKFAECSLQYCLINQLNSENCFALLTDKVNLNSFYSFKVFVKSRILNSYQH